MKPKKISKARLEEMYRSMTNAKLCKKLGISKNTLTSYIERAGIPLKGKGNKKSTRTKLIVTED